MSGPSKGIPSILLVCREGVSREVYYADLTSSGVLLICVQSLMGFFRREVYCPISGILVDMPTYMRCSDEEKSLMAELVGIFPSLRLKCHESSGEIRTLPFGTTCPGNFPPAAFVQTYCRSVHPRYVRASERSLVNLSALLSRTVPHANGLSDRSVTAHVSCSGCFLVSFDFWLIGERGWLTLPQLSDSAPISVEVCSLRKWGECRSLPGIGVRFIDLTEAQKCEITVLGGRSFFLDE